MESKRPGKGPGYDRIYAAVRRIPKGRVATYGQIARVAGLPGHARQVGYALSVLKDDAVPWQRVVNAKGEISPRGTPNFDVRQRSLLKLEGVAFASNGTISLRCFQWALAARDRAVPEKGPPPAGPAARIGWDRRRNTGRIQA